MISFEEAHKIVLESIYVLPDEDKHLLDCLGQVVTKDIYAKFNVPTHDNSAMDGYAVRAEDIRKASADNPKTLNIKGEVPAGKYPRMTVGPGDCVRIMTGGVIPKGADAVVPIEDTYTNDSDTMPKTKNEVKIIKEYAKGALIRRAGEDITEGALLLNKGKILDPASIGVLASQGISKMSVIRRPVVSIIATGNELISPGAKLNPGKLYNSNSYALAAQVKSYGGIPKIIGVAKDSLKNLTSILSKGMDSDLIVTSGGVSVGDYDIVKKALMAQGDIIFWRVRMKPGKPLTFGIFTIDGNKKIPHIGLPGNPVSCMLAFELFGRPSILKMMGRTDFSRPIVNAILQDEISNNDGRRVFARVIVMPDNNGYIAKLTGSQGSGVLTSMLKANALAIVPEDVKRIGRGQTIKVMLLD